MPSPSPKKHLTVLGAGPCGLFAAYTALDLGAQVTVMEKAGQVGGLASGHLRNGNWYDLGVHMLHSFDREVFDTCAKVMGRERVETELKAHIQWQNKTYRYPLRGRDILTGIPPITLARCLAGLLIAEIEARCGNRPDSHDAESALCELYGTPLYEFFFEDFTHRYWGIHPRDLSAEFVRRKMPRLAAVDVIKNLLEKLKLTLPRGTTEGALRFETLHYSATGAETLPRSLAKSIQERGAQIMLNSAANDIRHQDNIILSASSAYPDSSQPVFISTIPLPQFVHALNPPAPENVLQAVHQLRFKPMVVFALLVNKPKCMDALYTYYRNRIFHRVGEPKNAGLIVKPQHHTILIVEATCKIGDDLWNGHALPDILRDLEAEQLCSEDDIVEHHLLQADHAYPIFTKGFEEHLQVVTEYLSRFNNLRTTGRQGAFTYPNMHTAMRMGAKAAQELIPSPPIS